MTKIGAEAAIQLLSAKLPKGRVYAYTFEATIAPKEHSEAPTGGAGRGVGVWISCRSMCGRETR